MSKPQSRRDVPISTIAFGASAMRVETRLWCSMRPVINAGKCVSCLRCWIQCPDDSITLNTSAKVNGINLFFCKGCALCERLCPTHAITMHSESSFPCEEAHAGEHQGEVSASVSGTPTAVRQSLMGVNYPVVVVAATGGMVVNDRLPLQRVADAIHAHSL